MVVPNILWCMSKKKKWRLIFHFIFYIVLKLVRWILDLYKESFLIFYSYRTGKDQFSFESERNAMPKNAQLPHNCTQLTC